MNTQHQPLISYLKAGKVYRRDALLSFSKAIDRDLAMLIDNGELEKVAGGLYYKPKMSRYGTLPPSNKDLVKCFLRDDPFLLYSWNQYNTLGLGLTQLYNRWVVYNRKRHGLFVLGVQEFDFRRPSRGFPQQITPEFLLVDLVNNLAELDEDITFIKKQIENNFHRFSSNNVMHNVKLYGKVSTQYFFKEFCY